MSAFARLTKFTRKDAQAASDDRRLSLSVLLGDQPYPTLSTPVILHQPNTGLHFRKGIPMVVQFPQDILNAILAYVEPIWLFQLEDAYPVLADYLSSQSVNKIWYDLLPAALMSEPEYYQDEREVEKNIKALQEAGIVKLTHDGYSKRKVGGKVFCTSDTRTSTLAKSSNDGTIILPQIKSVSILSKSLQIPSLNAHPSHDLNYPLVYSEAKLVRARVLALGGTYDPSIAYRREIAGQLHSAKRCYLCLEGFISTREGSHRKKIRDWGMYWCKNCLKQWTIQSKDIEKIVGLHAFLENCEDNPEFISLWWRRFKDSSEPSWKPLVDDVLRKSIGMDFDIAIAKNQYLRQVSTSLMAVKRPITALRQALRRDIVHLAQGLSTCSDYDHDAADLAKKTFAKPTELGAFLFRAGLLNADSIFEPYDPKDVWLSDPTGDLLTSREVVRKLGDTAWKTQKATDMLDQLFDVDVFGAGVTAFIKAADKYHVQRISNSITADSTIAAINQTHPPHQSPFVSSPNYLALGGYHRIGGHLDILLAKLYVYRGAFPNLPQLSAHELKLAKEVFFKKLVTKTCNCCPDTGLMIMPRGLEGMVRHYREAHPELYWESEQWTTVG